MVLRARCPSYGDGITFWPVAELVRQACAITNDDSQEEARSKIEDALEGAEDGALIADRVAAVTGFTAATTGLQETFWAIRRLLEWLGRSRPLVVVFDDIQWAEPTFLDLLEYLAGWCREVALLLLCLARPDLTDERPSWGTGTDNASSLHLAPLRDDESAELVAGLLGGMRLHGPAIERITDSAGGNPLFVEEMLRMLEDDGLLQRGNGGWIVAGDLSDIAVPASIQALLGARLDRLSAGELAVIRCASVVGKVFWWGSVEELAPAEVRPHVGGHLQTLVRKDLIRPELSSFSGEDAFRFHHILIQDAAYTGTPKEIRADLHERFAGWVERAAGERVTEVEEMIGYHLEQAYRYRAELGRTEERVEELAVGGARRLAVAGRRASARGDMAAAADLLSRAAAFFPDDHPERREILPDLGEALSEAGDLARADAVVDEAAELAERADDLGLRAHAAIVGLLLLESTDPKRRSEEVLTQVEDLSRVFEGTGDDLGLSRAHRFLGDVQWTQARYAAADESFERAIEHARRAGAVWEENEVLGQYIGSGVYGTEPASEAGRRCEEVLAGNGVGTLEARALRALASVRAMEGEFDEARSLGARARSTLEELGLRLRATFMAETLGSIETLAGDFVDAERELPSRATTPTVELGERGFQATIAAELAHALVAQEQARRRRGPDEAERGPGAQRRRRHAGAVAERAGRASFAAREAGSSEAESLVREAAALAEETDDLNMRADTFVDLGEVLRAAGREGGRRDGFGRALELYGAKGNVVGADDARRRLASLDAPV